MVSELSVSDVTPARNVDLCHSNTLALHAFADYAIEVTDVEQLPALIKFSSQHNLPWWVLGGGSNVVLPARLRGVVLLMRTRGIALLQENDTYVEIGVAAGENWDDLVATCVDNGWYGLENLSLIPGSCGAAPVQNIGAYGVEIAQLVAAVEYFDIHVQRLVTLDNAACEFSYRDSVFKHALRGKAIITRLQLRLSKVADINLDYPALRSQFAVDARPAPREVRQAVIAVRRSKLPDPAVLPNVGSFFKNPVISAARFRDLQKEDAKLVHYPQADGSVKLAAGYLVDRCGWKGRQHGPVRVHELQALVLINGGGATAADFLRAADAIRADVAAHYGVTLEIEPDRFG